MTLVLLIDLREYSPLIKYKAGFRDYVPISRQILWVHYWYKLWLERTVGSRDGGALGDKSENSNSSQGLAWKGYSCSQAMLARKKVELDTMMLSRVTHPDLVQTT